MTLRLASRRLALPCTPQTPTTTITTTLLLSSSSSSSSSSTPTPSHPQRQVRTKWSLNPFKAWGKSKTKDRLPPDSSPSSAAFSLDDPKKRAAFLERNMHGSLSNNIFQDEIDSPSSSSSSSSPPSPNAKRPPTAEQEQPPTAEPKTRENTALVTDPDPLSRIRWHRKKIIQMVRAHGVRPPTKQQTLKSTERQLLHKSHFLPTSTKKLVMLSRQIAGKSLEDAITQMAWSKKKMAAEVKYYLEEARDLAIAQRGMGLGRVTGEVLPQPRRIQTKDGRWIEVSDPTRMYIAQSWVGRGPWRGKELDYKGRGRMGLIQHPSTSFTVLLKEEKTRLREYDEQEAKKAAKGPWVHLPNRPVYGQRPYYSW